MIRRSGLAVYPGSFDPPTRGHLDVIARAARTFSRLVVAVVANPQKRSPFFTIEEREAALRECLGDELGNVSVDRFRGLLADYITALGADVIVKGLRGVSDFENEMATAHMNRSLSGVDTMFLMTDAGYSFVSSSLVKEVFLEGGDIAKYVPGPVLARMNHKRTALGGTTHVDLPRHR